MGHRVGGIAKIIPDFFSPVRDTRAHLFVMRYGLSVTVVNVVRYGIYVSSRYYA
jgi:hypothetical protein